MADPARDHGSFWKALGLYAGVSWLALQVVDVLVGNLVLPAWAFRLTLVLLLIGLPITIGTAYVQSYRASGETDADRAQHGLGRRLLTWRNVLLGAVAALALWGVAVTSWLVLDRGEATAAEVVAGLEEIDRLTGEADFHAAYDFASRLDRRVRDDSTRATIWEKVSLPIVLQSIPPGARVFRRDYRLVDAPWEDLGRTPLAIERFPRGLSRIRAELPGHRIVEMALSGGQLASVDTIRLDPEDALPAGMVRVPGHSPGRAYGLYAPGLEQAPPVEIGPFLMATREVTNREFKAFVDAGGYRDADCWRHAFVDGGDTLSFDEAMGRFRDSTGQPGPRTWDAGSYPRGEGDLPVGGVSWYEAEAYACFAGMALPTVYHWYAAANPFSSPYVVPLSNFGDGPAPVASHEGISRQGIFDLAGNVREWTRNAHGEARFILGGGWADAEYAFNDAVTAPALDRSPLNGIRLVQYSDSLNLPAASAPLDLAFRDYRAEVPVSDEVFEVFRQMYAYEDSPLNARVIAVDTSDVWIREQIELDAGYQGDRLTTFLFRPRDHPGPHQTVVWFPGSNVIYRRSSDDLNIDGIDFLLRSGRALVFPVYKGTFERESELRSDIQDESNAWREHMIAWTKDLRRSLDYVASREEFDVDRLAYVGFSWGGAVAPVMAALEDRIRANVIIVGGLLMQDAQPVADPFHFLPRVRQPTLMISARWDSFYPLETSARPFFDRLGTPSEHRRMIVIDANHGVFSYGRNTVVQETLDWLDRYLGPVE